MSPIGAGSRGYAQEPHKVISVRDGEDEKWMVSDRGSGCDEVGRVAALASYSRLLPADLKSPAGTSSGGCIPTYQPDGRPGPLARPKWWSPPRAADPLLPSFYLPAQPWLWIRGRPHVGGQD
ncbi:unnamed protein product [Pleuronectes platessa]|uniref:Uncharacterized protein n=1 Tax=Pleuronectes platessa TaxID=8262 RepID=A0A9N7U2J7_PLEPL|nr:unnamed protein product [Pleuronectes platessa]